MIFKESEDMSFRVSQLEKNFKGMVKTLDIYNLEKIIEKKLEENMERMISLLQHIDENYLMVIMWAKVLKMIEIVLILRNHPLVSILMEGSILTLEVIRDGSQGVFNFPILT